MFMASSTPKGAAVDDWIVIPNWERFQHYKDRNPTWIKLYTELESDPDWDDLTLPQRGLLVTVWLMYARSRGQCTRKAVAKQVGRSYKAHSLEVLNHAGFIHLSASRPLALRYPRGREEIEKEPPNPRRSGGLKPSSNKAKEQKRAALIAAATNFAENRNGIGSLEFDTRLDWLEVQHGAILTATERQKLWELAFQAPAS